MDRLYDAMVRGSTALRHLARLCEAHQFSSPEPPSLATGMLLLRGFSVFVQALTVRWVSMCKIAARLLLSASLRVGHTRST
jgi:hypothetical protein